MTFETHVIILLTCIFLLLLRKPPKLERNELIEFNCPLHIAFKDPSYPSKVFSSLDGQPFTIVLSKFAYVPYPPQIGCSYNYLYSSFTIDSLRYEWTDSRYKATVKPIESLSLVDDEDLCFFICHVLFDRDWFWPTCYVALDVEIYSWLENQPKFWESMRGYFKLQIYQCMIRHITTTRWDRFWDIWSDEAHRIAKHNAKHIWEIMPEKEREKLAAKDKHEYQKYVSRKIFS